jgi:hypothetical protein
MPAPLPSAVRHLPTQYATAIVDPSPIAAAT